VARRLIWRAGRLGDNQNMQPGRLAENRIFGKGAIDYVFRGLRAFRVFSYRWVRGGKTLANSGRFLLRGFSLLSDRRRLQMDGQGL